MAFFVDFSGEGKLFTLKIVFLTNALPRMNRVYHPIYLLSVLFFLFACQETERPKTDFGFEFQPLQVGLFWQYAVEETIVFGENDQESSSYQLRDKIEYTFRNAEGEEVFVVNRDKSTDGTNWTPISTYGIQRTNQSLLRTFENKKQVPLVFPPKLEKTWDAQIYNSDESDEFEIVFVGNLSINGRNYQEAVKVLQEEEDDEITFRDNRYEVFAKGIGLVEHYYEVNTYCSRNDCLGKKLLDSGRKTHMKLSAYGKL
jgi:hypothetical protein